MKKIACILFFCSIFAVPVFGQGEAANWYFGNNAGLNFNTSPPTALTDGALQTLEGCATISDSAGNLLFYTNGTLVWNRDHQVMPNGFGLLGEDTSTQSAIIVPNPQQANIYYIFTVDGLFPGENNPANLRGLNFSEVDMNLDGGLGDIVDSQKNINLLPTNSEKITAVRNADCESIWVITHFVDRFYAYDVSSTGVNLVPIESVVDPIVPIIGYRDNALGYLKSSPDGTKLAIAHATLNENPASDASSPGKLLVYDFDTATGLVSGELDLEVNNGSPYGVEFSPNSQVLYSCVGLYTDTEFDRAQVYQYDLSDPDPSSTLTALTTNDASTGALQLGIDGRIYRVVINQTSLDAINNPDIPGPGADYQFNAVSLGGRSGNFGLPPFIQSLFLNTIDIIQNGESATNLEICEGDSYTLVAIDIPGASYTWTQDGVLLADTDFDLVVTSAGLYRVEVDPMNGECPLIGQATVIVNPLPTAFDARLVQCDLDGSADGITQFNLTQANNDITGGDVDLTVTYHLSAASAAAGSSPLNATAYANISNPQVVFARVTDQNNCSSISELTLVVGGQPIQDAVLAFCDDSEEDGFIDFNLNDALPTILAGLPTGLSIDFYASLEDVLTETNPIGPSFRNTVAYNQTVFARLEDNNACFGVSQIELIVYGLPQISTNQEIIYCLNSFPETIQLNVGEIIDTDSPISAYTFLWSTGEITPSIAINEPGLYTVNITNPEGCSKTRSIVVNPSAPANIDSIVTTDLVEDNTITVIVSGPGDYVFAIDNILGPYQSSNVFNGVDPGVHTIYVKDLNDCGISQQIVSIIGFPNFFTPNGDGYHDTWQVLGVRNDFQAGTKIYIYDRYGKMLAVIDPLGAGWDGIYNGNPMPSSDYWFFAVLEDGREVRSHFSLIR